MIVGILTLLIFLSYRDEWVGWSYPFFFSEFTEISIFSMQLFDKYLQFTIQNDKKINRNINILLFFI